MKNPILDVFGELFIQFVRDLAISNVEIRLQHIIKGHQSKIKYKAITDKLNEEEKELLHQLMTGVVDIALHKVLFFFEERDEFKIMIQTQNGLIDIKEFASGELQGYIFEWAEKYSKYPIEI